MQVQKPSFDGCGYSLSAVGSIQFVQNVGDMYFHGPLHNSQRVADFFVALALRDQLQDTQFARRQFGLTQLIGQPGGDLRGKILLAGVDGVERVGPDL